MGSEILIRTPWERGALIVLTVLLMGWVFAALFFVLWRLERRDSLLFFRNGKAALEELSEVNGLLASAKGFARFAILPLLQVPDGEPVLVDKNALSLVLRDLGMDSHGNDLPPEEDDEEKEVYAD